jgi:hypothetical protein
MKLEGRWKAMRSFCEAKARLRYPMKTKTGSQVDQPPNGSLSNRGKLKDEREETLLKSASVDH